MSRTNVTELRVQLMSRAKVTRNVRQGIKPDSLLPRDPKTSSGALQELNKADAFWQYQFLQRATHLG